MGRDFQEEVARESYQKLGQLSAREGYLDALDGKIAELEAKEAEEHAAADADEKASRANQLLLDEAERQIRTVTGGIINPAYGDELKVAEVRDYLVNGLKLTDPNEMYKALQVFLNRPQKLKFTGIDRIYHAVSLERGKLHDTTNLL